MILRVIRGVKNRVLSYYKDIEARKNLKQWSEKSYNTERKIKVGFIMQMPEIWDKISPVYEEMKKNDLFETTLLVVPAFDIKSGKLCRSYGEEKKFISEKYPLDKRIDVVDKDGKVIDVSEYHFDYVFYQRPYEHYLPKELGTERLVKFTKTCYIPYAYQGATVFTELDTNKEFFRNIYLTFTDSDEVYQALSAKFKKNIEEQIQKVLYVGYPVFDTYLTMLEKSNTSGILWTPRWSFDPKMGGSHFVDYKDSFLLLRKDYSNHKIIIRPHPLMWENVVKEGLMTQTEVDKYKDELGQNNIIIDVNKMLEDTVSNSRVLIADYSSIIINYFMTGKPIIYCPFETELSEVYKKLLSGMYIANSWEDVEKYLAMINRGEDILYDIRQEIINKELKQLGGGTTNIVNAIVNDFNKVN